MMECNQVEKEVEADISAKMKDVLLDPIEAVDENAYESSEENDSQGDSNDENYVGNDYPDDLDDDALADDNDSVPDDYYGKSFLSSTLSFLTFQIITVTMTKSIIDRSPAVMMKHHHNCRVSFCLSCLMQLNKQSSALVRRLCMFRARSLN